ncbi:MAG: YigZ family protein [Brotaphodocola sp.]
MIERYKILFEGGEGELVEKKSRFIATTKPVKSEEEAIAFIEEMKKKYWDARHNCSAYVIGERGQIQRCSDDGEPSQTAGRPMLDVLLGEEVRNICVVVTRYFGGTLLGTGGLVRAYSGAVQEGLKNSVVVEKFLGHRLQITTDYNGIGKIQYVAAQMGLTTLDTEYTDQVVVSFMVPASQKDQLIAQITEKTNGRAVIEDMGSLYYGVLDKEVLLFD